MRALVAPSNTTCLHRHRNGRAVETGTPRDKMRRFKKFFALVVVAFGVIIGGERVGAATQNADERASKVCV